MKRGRRRRRSVPLLSLAALGTAGCGLVAAAVVSGAGAGTGAGSASSQPPELPSLEREPALGASSERSARRKPEVARSAPREDRPARRLIEWRRSEAVGTHSAGSLRRGVLLPADGRHWVSWDPILKRTPNRQWRRWGTDRMVRMTLGVLREFGRDNPRAPKIPVGDLSRPHGGDFGPQFGAIGHASHQNGLDVDVYYPRRDGKVKPPDSPDQVDVKLAQDLVDRFVAAGAEKVFVGPNLPLTGPPDVVVPLVHHDNHLHARLPL